jgi:hypothetical protein
MAGRIPQRTPHRRGDGSDGREQAEPHGISMVATFVGSVVRFGLLPYCPIEAWRNGNGRCDNATSRGQFEC